MNIASYEDAERAVMKALGEELKRVRTSVGLSRNELVDQMPSDIQVRTYATYELGTRQCTVARFVEVCTTLGVAAPDVLELALQRAKINLDAIALHVDLHAVVNDSSMELEPLRQWAHNRLASNPDDTGIARLTRAVIQEMAVFFGYTRSELVKYLIAFTPRATPQR